jgi:predicted site-specific integrase-resolvase
VTAPKKNTLPYPPPFMDGVTLAQHLCISVNTIPAWVADGTLPAPRERGGKLLWKWSEVEDRLTLGKDGVGPDAQAERIRSGTRAAAAEARPRH